MNTRGPRLNALSERPGSSEMTPADGELRLADRDGIADREAELREQFRAHQRAVVLQQRVRVRPAILQRQPAIKGKARLHRAKLDNLA